MEEEECKKVKWQKKKIIDIVHFFLFDVLLAFCTFMIMLKLY